ncbi:MAG: choice-of-anchor J domain-containing protein [Saprospiraceae bacterium]|nr:choice-of-anchor J domain-containing protein [Saprospiraceae bacterium]
MSKLEMSEYSKLLQIANTSIDLAKKTGSSSLTPREAKWDRSLTNAEAWESTLVYIKDASLTGGSIFKDTKIYVDDGTGSINLYTRSAASFASTSVPTAKVNITGVIGQFNDNYQLSIRNIDDVKDAGGGNPTTDIFKDDLRLDWANGNAISEKGAQVWTLDATHGNPGACAKISGFANSVNNENEDWLISPKIDLTSVSTGALYFDNTKNYTGNDVELYVSKNYSGTGSPSVATWTQLSFVKSAGSWNYVSSGKIDLSGYNGSNIYIAFKYTSTTSASSTWELDNVKVVK